MVHLRPATALLALVHADPLRLCWAFNEDEENEVVANLVFDAEFHRAMLSGTGGIAGGSGMTRPGRRGLRALLANIRRKKQQQKKEMRALTVEVTDDKNDTAPPVECVPEPPINTADADVGVLSFSPDQDKCEMGTICIPSDESAKGGMCLPTTTERTLQGNVTDYGSMYCPPGCPEKVCECYENYILAEVARPQECQDALVDSCRDGSYVNYCTTGEDYQLYYQGLCDGYVCLDDKGIFDINAFEDYMCDLSDIECGDCYCKTYTSWCDLGTPFCAKDPSSSLCDFLDQACSVTECCAEYGGECFVSPELVEPVPTEDPDDEDNGDGDEAGDGDGDGDPSNAAIATNASKYALLIALVWSALAPAV